MPVDLAPPLPLAAPLKLFVSYSRRDKAAAQALVRALESEGFAVFIDLEALEFGEEWQRQLAQSIAAADTVVWLVTPASVTSRWCQWELGEVVRLCKRLMPVRIADIDAAALPPAIGRVHMLPAEGVYDPERDQAPLVRALNTDSAWVREGTALLARAHQWRPPSEDGSAAVRADSSALLSGAQLRRAAAWHERRPPRAPPAARQVVELILASRDAERRRRALGAAAMLGVIAIAATAWWQWDAARQRRTEAQANQSRQLLAAAHQAQASGDAVRAALLALEAMPDATRGIERPLLPEAEGRLYAALQSLREERVLPDPAGVTLGVMPQAAASAVPLLGQDHALRLLDAENGRWLGEHRGPEVIPIAHRWSPAARRLLVVTTAFDQQPARTYLWDTGRPALIGALEGHAAEIRATAFSGDGRRLALVDEQGVVSLHDAADGRLLRRWQHDGSVEALALDAQGRRLAGADGQGNAMLWDAGAGRLLRQLKGRPGFGTQALYFAGDDRELVAVGVDGWLQQWRLSGSAGATASSSCPRPPAMRAHTRQIGASTLSGSLLATGDSGGGVALWSLAGEPCDDVAPGRIALDSPVRALDAGTEGDTVLIHTRDEPRGMPASSTLHLWQRHEGPGAVELRGHPDLAGMALLDGGRLLSHGGRELRIWRIATPAQRDKLAGHAAWVTGVSVSPDGKRALSHGSEATARLWDPASGSERARLAAGGTQVLASAFSSDGLTAFLLANNGELSSWSSADGGAVDRKRLPDGGSPEAAQFAPGGRRLLMSHGARPATLWDPANGSFVARLDAPAADPPAGATLRRQVARAAFSGNGRWLLTAAEWQAPMDSPASAASGSGQAFSLRLEPGLRLWDASNGALVRRIDMKGAPVETFVTSADGTRLAVGFRAGRVAVFSLPEGRLLFEREMGPAARAPRWAGLAFSPDGQWLAGSYGGAGEVWGIGKHERHVMLVRGLSEVGAPAFTPDSRRLLTRDGRSVRLWDLESGEVAVAMEGHRLTVAALAFDPKGRWVLSASLDRDLRRWPLHASRAELQARAWSSLPRCLSDAERAQLALAPGSGPCRAAGARP
ncbi:toll/interleukin-1 receptor domain-containing protein [Aquincola sp. S2]|uniref:Toll/interleukin-1 receptor domain-containing protein n=1 Tax=Pseudaquabacterium terrae TaxID=2732868 RepID=A0ABX2ERQ1_9BURK|nr:toll/interleukin-1 receptor domain-containing protein [Aquabacterium terrae]NRF71360.1 toll/interleukin-1 receptor domain-containing protein [Aquabacterium terrae]